MTTSLADARAIARGDALRHSVTEIAVIGGAEIYAQWMDMADRLEMTEVHAEPEGDTCFAAIDPAAWQEVARVRHPAASRRQRRLFLCDISPAEAELTAFGNVYIDN